MKTKEELNAIREEIANLETKLKELSEEELEIVGGGIWTAANIRGEAAVIGHINPGKKQLEVPVFVGIREGGRTVSSGVVTEID